MAAPPDPDAPTLADIPSPLGAADARRAIHAIAIALAEAHHDGRVHGALAPRHVVRGADGPEVHGFGEGRDSRDGAFAAPEVGRGAPPDAAADIWALGAIAHQLLAGVPPVAAMVQDEEGGRRVAHGAVESIGSARPDLVKHDPELVGLVDRMLDRRPTERPSARGVRLDLGAPPPASDPDPLAPGVARPRPSAPPPTASPLPAPASGAATATGAATAAYVPDWGDDAGERGRRRPLLILLAILVLGGGGAAVAYAITRPSSPKPAARPAATTSTVATTAATEATATLAGSGEDDADTADAATGSTDVGGQAARTRRLVAWADGVERVLRFSATGRARAREAEQALGICDFPRGTAAARATIANRREALRRLDRLDTPPAQVPVQRLLERALGASATANEQRVVDAKADERAVAALPATGVANDCDGYTPTASQSNADDRTSATLKERFVERWNALPARAKAPDWDASRI